MKTVYISGGLGDCINQIAKLITLTEANNWNRNDVHVTYCRDTTDDKIVKDNSMVTGNDYADWVISILHKNDYVNTTVVRADQFEYAKQNSFDVVFGPNMDYSIKIWEQMRGAYIGLRPNELQMVPTSDIVWKHEHKDNVDVIIQVRFDDEWKTKVGSSFRNEAELLYLIKYIKEKLPEKSIYLVGQTNKNVMKFSKLVNVIMDMDICSQQDYILSAKEFAIVNEGYGSNLCLSAGLKTFRKRRDDLEYNLQTSPKMKEHSILVDEYLDIRNHI